ncbi:MAG: DUF2062 domain-containing protein [Candidatus Omnitrophica bacterium]|nr:DUF2062 domain-containing protein [Candidatus Omnitrophota bacterium]
MTEKIKAFFHSVYTKLVKMDDSPQRIALGFGVGVFLGILPGTGPIAALAAAFIFKINKAAALLGSLLTNTWLSVVTFFISIKIGSAILGVEWVDVQRQARDVMDHFSWKALFDVSLLNVLKPLLAGYAVVGLICGCLAYALVLVLLKRRPG